MKYLAKFLKNPTQMGSISPSSAHLAQEITNPVDACLTHTEPQHFLEIGPGTGVFTKEIVKKLRPQDHLDLVEIDSQFTTGLKKAYSEHANVTVFEGSILDWNPSYSYNVIISGLPLNAFPVKQTEQVLEKYISLLSHGGYLSYFEYIAFSHIHSTYLWLKDLGDFHQKQEAFKSFFSHFLVERKRVCLNLPPAYVYHCQRDGVAEKKGEDL